MTDDDRSLERAARSWLEIGPAQAPARAVEAALLRIETTPQERDLRILRRFTHMPMSARLATAAVIGVLAVGGAFYVFGRPQQNVGGPGPSPSASPTAFPSPSAALVSAPAPDRSRGDWQAMSDGAIDGLFGANERIQLSIDWGDSLHTWIQTVDGRVVLRSATIEAPAGEIHLVTDAAAGADALGCSAGEVGRYRWERSPDGMFLTLTALEDACANRATAMSHAWVHSLSAVNDGGLGVYPFGDGLQMTLPSMPWALHDIDLHTYNDTDPSISFVALQDPLGYDEPCGAGGRAPVPGTTGGGAASVAAYADYLRTRPGFDATVTDTQVDGRQAVHVKMTPKASYACQSPSYALFQDGAERDVTPGAPHSVWIVDMGGSTAIFWYEGDGVTAADEQAVISSFKFLDKLPTP